MIAKKMKCMDCFTDFPIDDYKNKNGYPIYKRCRECQRAYESRQKRKQRAAKKKAVSASPQQIHQDSLKSLRAYLIHQAGRMCQPCGHDKEYNLTLINLDGISLRDALYQYADNMNQDNWMYVISIYKRCIEMCHNCAGMYNNHDKALRLTDDMLWKANPNPKQPD